MVYGENMYKALEKEILLWREEYEVLQERLLWLKLKLTSMSSYMKARRHGISLELVEYMLKELDELDIMGV